MKFRGHETFFIRKGWLSKGMRHVKNNAEVFVSKEENPMDVLGIGSNMIKSLRYWMRAVGLTREPNSGKRFQSFTPFGELVYEHDRYTEELGTLQLLHYKLASNEKDATSWFYFFNKFKMMEFTKEDFVRDIQNYLQMNGESASLRSLDDDFGCIVSTYLSRVKAGHRKDDPENNIECPLAELGLIDVISKKDKSYKKSMPSISSFNPWVVLAVIMDNAKGANEISLNELLNSENNIGCVFNLDSIGMLEVLRVCEKTGVIKIIRTAGLDVIHLNEHYTFEDCVKNYYKAIEEVDS